MLWSKIINLLTAPSYSEPQFKLNNSVVKMYEDSQILTCEDIETYLEMEDEDLTEDDIDYADYMTDYDY